MRKPALALAVMFFASSLRAQSTTLRGELVVSNITLTGVSAVHHQRSSESMLLVKQG